MENALTGPVLEKLSSAFNASKLNLLAQKAVMQHGLDTLVDMSRLAWGKHTVFSDKIEKEGKVTNQKQSGRCWLFAACNLMRNALIRRYDLDRSFELSQNYLFFYDKLEKANFFLENVLKTMNEPVDGRLVQFLLATPVEDGGQWDMIVNLIRKYGVVPKSVYPEVHHSEASARMKTMLTSKLREFATILRREHANGVEVGVLRTERIPKMMEEVYQFLAISLGEPPKVFDWSFEFDDKETKKPTIRVFREQTPLSFYEEHVQMDLEQYVSVIHDPRNAYTETYTVDYLGNVLGGHDVLYLNLPVEEMKDIVVHTIRSGEPVWFGCDVGKFHHRDSGLLDTRVFAFEESIGYKYGMSKAERLVYGESLMTHAMMFTAFDVDASGVPTKFRVENSWGEKRGANGFLTMSSEWFNEFMYQVVVHKSRLSDEQRAFLDKEPHHLPAWDPMGSLA